MSPHCGFMYIEADKKFCALSIRHKLQYHGNDHSGISLRIDLEWLNFDLACTIFEGVLTQVNVLLNHCSKRAVASDTLPT